MSKGMSDTRYGSENHRHPLCIENQAKEHELAQMGIKPIRRPWVRSPSGPTHFSLFDFHCHSGSHSCSRACTVIGHKNIVSAVKKIVESMAR